MRSARETRWRHEVARLLDNGGLSSAAANFRQCGECIGVATCGADHSHYQALEVRTCHLRFCPVCARKDSQKLVAKYEQKLREATAGADRAYRFRMITLTTDVSLFDPDINEKFRAMYQRVSSLFDNLLGQGRPYWSQKSHRKYTGEGYLCSAEFGEDGRKLHFHVLFFGRYIQQSDLSANWCAITGYRVVWIEKLRHGLKDGLKEALKYVTKFSKERTGAYAGFPDAEMIARLAQVYHATRRVRTRGLFYNLPTPEEIIEAGDDNKPVACPECLNRLVMFSPESWDMQHPEMTCRQLHLKLRNKFHARATSPP